jgi:opacity protein-like surface antigen
MKKHKNSTTCQKASQISFQSLGLGLAALCGPLLAASAGAADAPALSKKAGFQKPAWLGELSGTLKESYDDNLFMVENGKYANRSSWVTTVSPKAGFNLVPLLGEQTVLQALSLAYAPDFSFFHEEDSEDFTAHKLNLNLKGKTGNFSFSAENGFSYIDGEDEAPTYDRGRNAYAIAGPRERREQFQDRAKITLQYDKEKWFVRPTASLLYFDLRTDLRNVAGYDNYCDRYDVNGGLDLGYKIMPKAAVTLGYRYGHQDQQQFSFDAAHLSSPSDYHRVLFGFEGKPLDWLTISVQAGPDFRSYEENSATHTTPLDDLDETTYYAEASLAAEVTKNDVISFKYKQWRWLSSVGKLPALDSTFDLGYKHKFTSQLSMDLGARLLESDYTIANVASGNRIDQLYTFSAGVTYAFTSHLSASLAYSLDLGLNDTDGLTSAAASDREFERNLVSLGATYKF